MSLPLSPLLLFPPIFNGAAASGPREPRRGQANRAMVEKKKTGPRANKDYTDVAFQRATPPPPSPPPAGALPALRQEDKWAEIRPPGPMCVVIQKGRRAVAGRSRPTAVLGLGVNDSGRRWFAQLENVRGNLKVWKCFLSQASRHGSDARCFV